MVYNVSESNSADGRNPLLFGNYKKQSAIPPLFNFSYEQVDAYKDEFIANHMRETQEREAKAQKYATSRTTRSVQIAQQELRRGVKEEGPLRNVGGKLEGSNDGNRIALYKGRHDHNAWCSSFVNYVCSVSQGKGNLFGMDRTYAEHNRFLNASASQAVRTAAEKNGILHDPRTKEGKKYQPKAGDLIVWTSRTGHGGHIGIIEKVNPDGSFTTIEGNTNDAIRQRKYNSVADAIHPKTDRVRKQGENYNGSDLSGFIDMTEYYKMESLGTLKKPDKKGRFK